MQTILITGGTGYIGSHTVLELVKEGKYEIIVFDNLKNGHREAIDLINSAHNASVKLIEGELLNYAEIERVFAEHKIDGVIHFAALIEAGISVTEPLRFFENNVSGSVNLLKAMQAHGVKKIVFSSTAAVYGTPSEPLVTETVPLNPESPYGSSKLMVETMLKALGEAEVVEAERVDSIVLRYFNAAGSTPDLLLGQDYPRPTHLITVAVQAALGKRDKLTLFGNDYPTPDGTCVRDYIHVQDLARAHVKALEYIQGHAGYEVFNVGTGKGTSNLEIVNMLEEIHGKFNWEFGPRRPGDPAGYYADNTKAREHLNWEPEFTVEDSLKHAYEWQKKYPNGYADKIKES